MRPARAAAQLARRRHVGRGRGRVGLGRLAQRLAVDEPVVEPPGAQPGDDLAQVLLDGLVREEPRVQLALDLLRELRPVAAHRLHAREDDARAALGLHQAGVALARPRRPVAHRGQAQPQVEPVEDEVEPALDPPALAGCARPGRG